MDATADFSLLNYVSKSAFFMQCSSCRMLNSKLVKLTKNQMTTRDLKD